MNVSLFPVFVVGLLGSVHCGAMCGGIVGALSLTPPRARATAAVVAIRPAVVAERAGLHAAAYNAGRLASYTTAGALAGGVAQGAALLSALPALQATAYLGANLMLAALGLHLMNAWSGIAHIERAGQLVWRRVRPQLAKIGPPDTPGRMLAAGALWGWLPCAMVYSVLVTAMLSGSAVSGALTMLAFGLGTLPMMLALGLLGARLRGWLRLPGVRFTSGAVVLAFGIAGLLRAAGGLPHAWVQLLCIAP